MVEKLDKDQIEWSSAFANGAMALAGHTKQDEESDDIRKVLAGEMTREEAMQRILERH